MTLTAPGEGHWLLFFLLEPVTLPWTFLCTCPEAHEHALGQVHGRPGLAGPHRAHGFWMVDGAHVLSKEAVLPGPAGVLRG